MSIDHLEQIFEGLTFEGRAVLPVDPKKWEIVTTFQGDMILLVEKEQQPQQLSPEESPI